MIDYVQLNVPESFAPYWWGNEDHNEVELKEYGLLFEVEDSEKIDEVKKFLVEKYGKEKVSEEFQEFLVIIEFEDGYDAHIEAQSLENELQKILGYKIKIEYEIW